MHYVLSAPLACPLQIAQGECARELLLEVAHDGRADKLWKIVPMAMSFIMPPSFLAMGISLAPKKYGLRCSGMNWWLAAILLLHSLQMALTASEFICLMVSALHPNTPTTLSIFAFLGQTT